MIQLVLPRDRDELAYVSTSLTLQKAEICTTNLSKFLSDLSYNFPLLNATTFFLLMSENIKFLFGDSLIKPLGWKGILNCLKNQHALAS